jgi:hypothetical protein
MSKPKTWIGIDMSMNSTAITLYSELYNKCFHLSYLRNKSPKKWMKVLDDVAFFSQFSTGKRLEEYSDWENSKISTASRIADAIYEDVKLITEGTDVIACMEGYSYSSKGASLIDIVTASTMVREKIQKISGSIKFVSPSTLKKGACQIAYGHLSQNAPNAKGKIPVCRNNWGLAGGSFIKRDMIQALLDAPGIDIPLKKVLLENWPILSNLNNIPTPWDDIIDSCWAMLLIKQTDLKLEDTSDVSEESSDIPEIRFDIKPVLN